VSIFNIKLSLNSLPAAGSGWKYGGFKGGFDTTTRHINAPGRASIHARVIFSKKGYELTDEALSARNAHLSDLLAKAGLDAARRDIAEGVQAVLTDELHHRMKNVLAMVTAIVRQSIRSAAGLEQAETAITRRLLAMAKAHDLLLKADWKAADLGEIVAGAIEQHDGAAGRIAAQGPAILVASTVILPLTMILNELCTNATKYGALSNDAGRVSLTWRQEDALGTLVLVWRENDGPPVSAPKARSFGSRLIESALPQQLGGSGKLDFSASGVTFTLTLPLAGLLALPLPKRP
jgi:two-component sensor histidine kinase